MATIRLLLAEDNPEHRLLLRLALTRERPRVEVREAASREEVLSLLGSERFSCMVLDYHLPPHDAPGILRDARPLLEDTPVVVISSIAEQRVVIESLRIGVADFVPKERAVMGDHLWERVQACVAQGRRVRMERRRAQRRLEVLRRASEVDPLTGLVNRRFVQRIIGPDRRRTDRRGVTSCVLMDIDHFKRVNDTRGHAAGDEVLRQAAGVLRRLAGAGDCVSRWGGEEFLVIKGSAGVVEAWTWADGVRRALEASEMTCGGAVVRVTASFGVATVPTRSLCEGSVALADRALYLAKDLGRNRVCTVAMAHAFEVAATIDSEPGVQDGDKALLLLASVGRLGAAQLDHVGPHSRLVRDVALRLGRRLGLDAEDLGLLETASLLHDIGKIAIPDALLAKPAALSEDERRFMAEHARLGAEICATLGMPAEIGLAVGSHHARHDDRGAPGATAREVLAPIICVADAYAAMITDRPYCRRRSPAEALAELRACSGRQFEPKVVSAMQSVLHGAVLEGADGRAPAQAA